MAAVLVVVLVAKKEKKVFSPGGMVRPVLALSIQTPCKFTTSAFTTRRPTAERFSAVVRSAVSEGRGGKKTKKQEKVEGEVRYRTEGWRSRKRKIDTSEREGTFSLSEAFKIV